MLSLAGSARDTAPLGSALSAVAALPPYRWRKERAASTVVAAGRCARRKAAPRWLKHVASAPSTVLLERARWMAAPPMQPVVALHTAGNTAESEKLECTALFKANARLASNTKAVQAAGRSQAAHYISKYSTVVMHRGILFISMSLSN